MAASAVLPLALTLLEDKYVLFPGKLSPFVLNLYLRGSIFREMTADVFGCFT